MKIGLSADTFIKCSYKIHVGKSSMFASDQVGGIASKRAFGVTEHKS